ncbi:MAG: NAD(P)-dependent oxidoreductase [Bacteriovoracaceae bacterium]|nr:NAD(P)-dependent oxidoreductase [Bacteriovoracaceae bacterium]
MNQLQKSKVLVIGGSGFIGDATVNELKSEGAKVTIYDHKPSSHDDVGFIEGCITEKEKLIKAAEGVDYIYHYAGWADMLASFDNPSKVIELNVMGTTNVLEACVKNNIKKLIFASSMYVFSKNGSFYRASKQCCELLIEEYSKAYGLEFCILRYGSLYGPGATHGNAVYKLITQALEEGKINYWGTGEEIRQYIHVKDAARGAIQILKEGFNENYVSITGLEDIQIKNLLQMINEILGGDINIETTDNPEMLTHYVITPFNFLPKTGRKLVYNAYKDLGQGILECIHEVYGELSKEKNSK